MTEDFGQYSDRTYRMLKGLRKFGQDGFQETICMEVPEKRNRALLPKYGQAVRAHCPQKGEILTKKVTDHEVIWLEYEEENLDCFESDVSPVTHSVETDRPCYSETCDEYVNYFKMLSSYSYESSLGEYHIEMIFDEQKLRELESDRFNILGMLLKSPNTRQDGPSTRADKYDANIHVVNADLCVDQLDIKETNVANVKEQMRKCLRHTENNTDENITTAATSGTTGEHTSKPYLKYDGAVTDVKEQNIPVGITDERKLHIHAATGANEGTPYLKDVVDLGRQNISALTVEIDIDGNATKANKDKLSCNSCTDVKELNSSAVTSNINGSKADKKPAEVIDDISVPIDVKEHISLALTLNADLQETKRTPAEDHDDAIVTTCIGVNGHSSLAIKLDAENIRETEVASAEVDNIATSDTDSVKDNKRDSSVIVTMGDGRETVVITAEAVDDPCNFSTTNHTDDKKLSISTVTEAAHDRQTETHLPDAGDGNSSKPSEAKKQLDTAVLVTSDDSDTNATVEEDIMSVNDTIDDKSNATEYDIDSLSDLSIETYDADDADDDNDDDDDEIDNNANTTNPPAPTEETEYIDDDDSGIMCGILWIYARSQ